MSDSQTSKKTVFLAGRVPAELKKRFEAAAAKRGWKTQLALVRILEQWVEGEERAAGAPFGAEAASSASMVHELADDESAEFRRGRRKSSKPGRAAR